MAIASFYLDTRREKKDGSFPIKINVRHKAMFLLSTGFSVSLNNWTGNEFTNKEANYKTKNTVIRKLISDIESMIFRLDMDGKLREMSDRVLKETLTRCLPGYTPERTKHFVDYMTDFMNLKDKYGTRRVYAVTINKIREFDPTCTFDTMDLDWLRRFERWMKDAGLNVNAVGINLRNIRAVFNYAIDSEITTLYPFRKFKIKKEETIKRSLTIEQVKLLRDYECEEHQKRYRDYCGGNEYSFLSDAGE